MYNTVIRVHEATRCHREKPLSTFKNQNLQLVETNLRGPSDIFFVELRSVW